MGRGACSSFMNKPSIYKDPVQIVEALCSIHLPEPVIIILKVLNAEFPKSSVYIRVIHCSLVSLISSYDYKGEIWQTHNN